MRLPLCFLFLNLSTLFAVTTYPVTNTANSGVGSFREALLFAASSPGEVNIEIQTGLGTISVTGSDLTFNENGGDTLNIIGNNNAIDSPGFSLIRQGLGTIHISDLKIECIAFQFQSNSTTTFSGSEDLTVDNLLLASGSGATLDLSGLTGAADLELESTGTGEGCSLLLKDSGTTTLSYTSASITFAVQISDNNTGTNTLSKTGSGIIVLSNGNTYTATTSIAEGVLALTGSGSIANSSEVALTTSSVAFDISGSTGDVTIKGLSGAGNVTLGNNSLSIGSSNASTTFSGAISGAGGVTKQGTGELNLSGASSYEGTTAVSGGSILLSDTGSIASSSNVAISSGAALATSINATIPNLSGVGDLILTDNLTFTLENDSDTTFSGTIWEDSFSDITSNLTKTGTGTLTLSGTNTYSGTTTISEGSVALSGTGSLASTTDVTIASGASLDISASTGAPAIGSLSGAGDVALGSNTLTIGGSNTSSTFSGAISGAGGVTKQGTGELNLSGASSYEGTTAVSGGSILLSDTGSIASSSNVAISSGAALATSINATLPNLSGAGDLILTDNLTFTLENDSNTTFSGTIWEDSFSSITSNLTKTGTGALTLSGTNTYRGATTISGGSLTLSGTGSVASSSGIAVSSGAVLATSIDATIPNLSGAGDLILTDNLTFTLENDSNTTFSGDIWEDSFSSIASNLTKTGTGTLTLSGTNTYRGATTISGGALALSGTGSLASTTDVTIASGASLTISASTGAPAIGSLSGAGDVALGSNTLTVGASNASTTFSGVISGAGGGVTKTGTGKLTLTGNNNYTGDTTVSGGTLAVTGAVGGTTTVGSGAILSGTGSLATVEISGTLQPGASIGTLTVEDITFNASSTLEVEINATQSDKVVATSSVTINEGATLYVIPLSDSYSSTYRYTFIEAPTISGDTFTLLSADTAFRFSVEYFADHIDLILGGVNNLTTRALLGNAKILAEAVDQLPQDSNTEAFSLASTLAAVSSDALLSSYLNQLSPSIYTALSLSQEALSAHIFQESPVPLFRKRYCLKQIRPQGLWGKTLLGFSRKKPKKEELGFISQNTAALLGWDYTFAQGRGLLGVMGSYSHVQLNWMDSANEAKIHSGYLGLYGAFLGDYLYINGMIGGAYNAYDISRIMRFTSMAGRIDKTAEGFTQGGEGSAHLRIGSFSSWEALKVGPFVDASYYYLYQQAFKEKKAGVLNLGISDKTSDLLRGEAGIELFYCLSQINCFSINASCSYVREQRGKGKSIKARFLLTPEYSFTVEGMNPSRNLVKTQLGFSFTPSCRGLTISMQYKGLYSRSYSDQIGGFHLQQEF